MTLARPKPKRNADAIVTALHHGADPLSQAIQRACELAIDRKVAEGAFGGAPPLRMAGSPEEWGVAYGFSGPKVRELIRRGLPHLRVGAQTRILFSSPDVLAWLRDNGDYLSEGGE